MLRPAIAVIHRPANYPDLNSGGKHAWEMRAFDGPPAFLAYPARITTDDPVRAGNHFAADLGTHAHRTGTRPWLLMPAAFDVFQTLPVSHLFLCFADQPPPAIARRLDKSNPESGLRWSVRVDANSVGSSTLIVDLIGSRWRLTRIDPVYREAGRVRIVTSVTADRIIDIQGESAETIGIAGEADFAKAGDAIRRHFWSTINPRLTDPFADGLSDPALKEQELTWTKGNPDRLGALMKMLAWCDHSPQSVYPFEVTIETAIDEDSAPRVLLYDRISDGYAARFDRALAQNRPVGWQVRRESDDALPRRSDWHRVPLQIKFLIPAPTGHEAMEAEFNLAEWLNPTAAPDQSSSHLAAVAAPGKASEGSSSRT